MCSDDTAVFTLDLRQYDTVVPNLAFGGPPVGTLAFAQFSPGATLLAMGFSGECGNCEIRDVEYRTVHANLHGPIRSAQFDASGAHIVTCSSDRTVRVWDTGTCSEKPEPFQFDSSQRPRTAPALDATLSPDGRRVLTAEHDGQLRLWWRLPERPWLSHEPCASHGHGVAVRFSPDGKHLACISSGGAVGLRTIVRDPSQSSDGAGTRSR
ncbi:hypothetical protein TRAPUB_8547 [Trametes pubescens]|uniref:Uncharacterized protein n=1 Tax=Trametes pubescens TaxID=154538 RepID=A0A1M2W4W4_TRAPU|nr:hypothetical protein TRAPUB_8547 [Trametes pubescens]